MRRSFLDVVVRWRIVVALAFGLTMAQLGGGEAATSVHMPQSDEANLHASLAGRACRTPGPVPGPHPREIAPDAASGNETGGEPVTRMRWVHVDPGTYSKENIMSTTVRWCSAALLACAACAPKVETSGALNPSMSAEVSRWRTYAWLPPHTKDDSPVYNDITRGRVETAVDRQLAVRGYTIDTENPDFRIAWHASIDRKLDVETFNDYYGYGWGWYGPGYSTYVDQYDEGTLILDFVDANANELAWRGVGQGRLSGSTAQQPTQDQIDEAVEEIMEEFPASLR